MLELRAILGAAPEGGRQIGGKASVRKTTRVADNRLRKELESMAEFSILLPRMELTV